LEAEKMSRTKKGEDALKSRPQKPLYIALEGLDFTREPAEVVRAIELYNQGVHYADIAAYFRRDGDEVALLLMDLLRKGKISRREGGCYGTVEVELEPVKFRMSAEVRASLEKGEAVC
jgi:hypothetical protein